MSRKIQFYSVVLGCLLLQTMGPALGAAPGDIAYEREDQSEIQAFPPSIFPHWIHRIHYRCDACHDSLFEMKKGATPVTMDLIGTGKACGACHNGDLAFDDDFTNCTRCHFTPAD
jgi:c(7)-type cytochrome triheme protein